MSVDDPSALIDSADISRSSTVAGATTATEEGIRAVGRVDLSNSWFVTVLAVVVWTFITALNVVRYLFDHISYDGKFSNRGRLNLNSTWLFLLA